ncbi:MAG TPA: hypothetical protein VGE74_08935 [Gemmata sp.]
MSWRVDGVYYHNWSEYQAALARSEQRSAEARLTALRTEAERHQRRVRDVEQQLASAQGNNERLARVNQELQSGLEDLRRVQNQVQAAQEEYERRSDTEFRNLRAQAEAAREDLAALDAAHQRHQTEVRAQFERARAETAAGLAEAERRRAETQQQLQTAIGEVNQRLDRERDARLAEARTEAETADRLAAYTDEQADALAARQDETDMRAEVTRIKEQVAGVRRMLAENRPAAALTLANANYDAVRAARTEADARAAYLATARERVRETAAHLTARLGDDEVKKFFARAAGSVTQQLAELVNRLPETHARYHRRDQIEKIEAHLGELEQEVLRVTSGAPLVREMDATRQERIKQVMERLVQNLGPSQSTQILYADPNDRKSVKIVRLQYGPAAYDLHFPLDPHGTIQVEGWGHSTNTDCQQSAGVLAQILSDLLQVTGRTTDARARTAPQVQHRPGATAWDGVETRLDRLREKL